MNFLAIDTSAKYLTVIAHKEGASFPRFLPEGAFRHSVLLMDEIGAALNEAALEPKDCDFFAVVTGPGSFTGIRIGIATVKGLCFATGKEAVPVTSFEVMAYHEQRRQKFLALVDAGKGNYYGCRFEKGEPVSASFMTEEEVRAALSDDPPVSTEPLPVGGEVVDPVEGLLSAVLHRSERRVPASELDALYLRKSSAEEHR